MTRSPIEFSRCDYRRSPPIQNRYLGTRCHPTVACGPIGDKPLDVGATLENLLEQVTEAEDLANPGDAI